MSAEFKAEHERLETLALEFEGGVRFDVIGNKKKPSVGLHSRTTEVHVLPQILAFPHDDMVKCRDGFVAGMVRTPG